MCIDIDVSALNDEDPSLLSGSVSELGPDAGPFTWRNCIALATRKPLLKPEERQDARDHFRAYGAWDRAEIDAWTDIELDAMVYQEGAAALRELEDYGVEDGRIYRASDGTLSLYLGN